MSHGPTTDPFRLRRLWALLLVALFASAALAGCTDDGDGGGDDTSGDDDTGGGGGNETDDGGSGGGGGTGGGGNDTAPEPFAPEVSLTSVPDAIQTGGELVVNWTIEGDGGDSVDETGVVYGQTSVPSPNATTDYNESAGAETDVTVPGNFTVNVTLDTNGTWYVRAYAKVGNETYYSDEGQVSVTDIEPEKIRIVAGDVTAVEPFPRIHEGDRDVTIAPGDVIVWANLDEEARSISSDTVPEGAEEFETGEIDPDGVSDAIEFTVPGDYTYTVSGDVGATKYSFTVE